MTRAWVVTLFWAALLAVHWVLMWAVFNPDVLPAGLLGGSALLTALGGTHLAWLARRDRRRRGEVVVEAVPDLSLATVLVGVAITLLPLGAVLGPWISMIGAGALLWGLVGVVNERRASRRAVAAVAGTDRAPGGTTIGPQGAAGHERAAEPGSEREEPPDRRSAAGPERTAEAEGPAARRRAGAGRSGDDRGSDKGDAAKGGTGRRGSSRSRRSSRR